MLRIDRTHPDHGPRPTLGTWELELLRSVEHVVRFGHIRSVAPGGLDPPSTARPDADDALVVTAPPTA